MRSTGAADDAGLEVIVFWRRPRYRCRYRKECCGITWKKTYIVMPALIAVVRALSHSVKPTLVQPWFGRNRFVVRTVVVRLNLTIPVSRPTQSDKTYCR